MNITRVNTVEELEQHLQDTDWSFITQDSTPGAGTGPVLCLICPFCGAMVPPQHPRMDWKARHIRYHVEMWRLAKGELA